MKNRTEELSIECHRQNDKESGMIYVQRKRESGKIDVQRKRESKRKRKIGCHPLVERQRERDKERKAQVGM